MYYCYIVFNKGDYQMRQINYGGKSYGGYEPELEMYPNGAGSVGGDEYDAEDGDMDEALLEEGDE